MKIYTKTGDEGETSLLGGRRVKKNDLIIEVLGAIDELNAAIGLVVTSLGVNEDAVKDLLLKIQGDLFRLGAEVAGAKKLIQDDVVFLEGEIDRYQLLLPDLHAFILPGGSQNGAQIHFARSVCRRVERELVVVKNENEVSSFAFAFVNRLADLLFVLARFVNMSEGVSENEWH